MLSPLPPAFAALSNVQVPALSKRAYSMDLLDSPFALDPTGVPLHPNLRLVLRLNGAHQQKVYYSGRLSKRVERGTDGLRPTKDEGWIDVWCQLGGATLSIWNMKEIEEAAAKGEEAPPQYVNITDAFVHVLGAVTFPATLTTPARRFTNVLTLNTAGSNLLLFVCESPAALVSWAAALRLASWEKSRLEEIYTAHLLRIILTEDQFLKEKTPHTPLVQGKFEGWARVRVAGQTNWQRLWIIITAQMHEASSSGTKKCRLSGLFPHLASGYTGSSGSTSRKTFSEANPKSSSTDINDPPTICFYTSNKSKELRVPTLSVSRVSQAFAVYPGRPDMIMRSTLVKIEGRMGTEEGAGAIKGTEAWVLVMPEAEIGQTAGPRKMLEWVVALHDAFGLYGRPTRYSFDPRSVDSLMFAHPADPSIDHLFLNREEAESLDPREDATSITRSRLTTLLQERMRRPPKCPSSNDSSLSIQNTQMNQPISKDVPQHGAQDQPDGTNPFISNLDSQPAIGACGPALMSIMEQSTKEERSGSPPGRMDEQQQTKVSTSAGDGSRAWPTSASAAVHEPLAPQLLYARPSTLYSPSTPPDLLTGSPRTPAMTFSQSQTNPCPAVGFSHSESHSPISPMMLNPMMTGMGGMPNVGMVNGFSPQQQFHMWIAQQVAAETYQRTMVALSQAGLVGSGQQQEDGRPVSGQWGMPWIGMNPMTTGDGMGMMPPGFGGSQFGVGMGGMDMQGMDGMGPMNSPSAFQGHNRDGPTVPARDSEDTPAENESLAAGGLANAKLEYNT
ncbi:hypothetical protein BDV93DRAFT_605840 [Ceratobasidium sp. AG-I]|nr:hypothetical protein BDV93DRAFT_605840 [Ceratobasidium sp. AG-I]